MEACPKPFQLRSDRGAVLILSSLASEKIHSARFRSLEDTRRWVMPFANLHRVAHIPVRCSTRIARKESVDQTEQAALP